MSTDDNEVASAAVATPERTPEEQQFFERTAALCQERNLPLAHVKNARDLCSPVNSPIIPGRVYRIGRVSDASAEDLELLFGKLGIKTFVDLRSPTELKDDPTLEREEVFGNFTDMVYYERSKMVKELGPEEKRMEKKRKRDKIRKAVGGVGKNTLDAVFSFVDKFGSSEEGEGEEDECIDCLEASKLLEESARRKNRKERHFVSIMNELKYKIKKPFLDEINGGGLPMLNELLLRFGAPGIKYVLDLVSDKNRHPVAFYCTAGKDRTGMIAAIILALLGTPDESIIEDYSLSANVYAEMNDHKAMVGALSQRSLDAKTFLGAPPHVMRATLETIRRDYGSVEGYCDFIGFDEKSRERLKYALTEP
ncbi:hypothetical protein ACHAXN_010898 [Cyclotella atomus]